MRVSDGPMVSSLPLPAIADLLAIALVPLVAASASFGWVDPSTGPSAPRIAFGPAGPLRRAAPGPSRATFAFDTPLFDRHLSAAEKAADLAPELVDAILRIEPIYDPTRLEGPVAPPTMMVSAGTAAMNNVFADRWRLATADATVTLTTTSIAHAWMGKGTRACEAFTTRRATPDGDQVIAALTRSECALLLTTEAAGFSDAPPIPVAAARLDVPVFAAPLPGARMTSADFWAAQKVRIAAIQRKLPGWGPAAERAGAAKAGAPSKREAGGKRADAPRIVRVGAK